MVGTIANFHYGAGQNTASNDMRGRSSLAVAIYSDRDYWSAEMAEDAQKAGLRVAHIGQLADLSASSARTPFGDPVLGDIVVIDCPGADDAVQSDVGRLGDRAARFGVQLVVSTSMDALDGVFGAMTNAEAQILVAPSRAERLIALATVMPMAGNRVRELSETDRLTLMRLTEQVAQLAQKLQQLTPAPEPVTARSGENTPFRFGRVDLAQSADHAGDRLVRTARPPLPDPRLVRRIVRQRQLRARFFEGELFADPAWDILLDLTAARAEHTRVSVSSLCIASGVPTSTALRWIGQLIEAGLLQRLEDETDRRRAFITLTDKAADAMARYFSELGPPASMLV